MTNQIRMTNDQFVIRISDFGFPPLYSLPMSEPRKILVVQPSWVGDAVMATPALRAIRAFIPRPISLT